MKFVKILIFFFSINLAYSQIENVPVSNPVYQYLERIETKGLLPHFSTSSLPLQRKEIVEALKEINNNKSKLSENEREILTRYLLEFDLVYNEKAVVFYSSSDSNQVLSKEFFSDKDKFFYHFKDSSNTVNIKPLGSFETLALSDKDKLHNVEMGNLGFRLYGSLGSHFGYYLQATNGAILGGERNLALKEIHKLQKNVKFADLNSDFDFSESHVTFNYNWFYANIGRETKLIGSGLNQRLFLSSYSPAIDAINLGAKFTNFSYQFLHGSLLATDNANVIAGYNSEFPSKYLAMHRFALKPKWGEIAFWEAIIYSKRGMDITYLNPLSFFKSLEHSLHDRDNSLMGGDFTVRPYDNVEIKGSYILDDLIFSKIGTGFWSNKSAWNISAIYASHSNIDFGIEYARVEPYTFTHFDSINTYTNDQMPIGTNLLPNSDEISLIGQYWWGQRYPIVLKISYQRHGANIYNKNRNLIKNVGGDIFQTHRYPIDPETVTFLDGDLQKIFKINLEFGWEFIRGFSIKANYCFRNINNHSEQFIYLKLMFEDF